MAIVVPFTKWVYRVKVKNPEVVEELEKLKAAHGSRCLGPYEKVTAEEYDAAAPPELHNIE